MTAERTTGLAALARPSGVFTMLALDQRESLRTLLHEATGRGATDADLTAFKVDAARALTPIASAVLLDVAYGLGPAQAAAAIAPGCGLLVAADRLEQAPGGPVEDTDVDDAVLDDEAIADVADGYKLLVIWRPDRGEARRRRIVERFVARCRELGRPSLVEGIVRPPGGAGPYRPEAHLEAVLDAARELVDAGPDLYKAEVPGQGRLEDGAIEEGSRRLSQAVGRPWVVLSNGVEPERFPTATLAAARGGASGFLAGRAIWTASLSTPDLRRDLETGAASRLRTLADAVERVGRPWTGVVGGKRG
jgi:sulfofructosephosphate aldolase